MTEPKLKTNPIVRTISVTTTIAVHKNGNCDYTSEYAIRDPHCDILDVGGSSHESLAEAIGSSAKDAVTMWQDVTDEVRKTH